MRIILVSDKWDTYAIDATDLPQAALRILRERVAQGYWYFNLDNGNPHHQYADRAEAIANREDGQGAWQFLLERCDFQYESVEIQETK